MKFYKHEEEKPRYSYLQVFCKIQNKEIIFTRFFRPEFLAICKFSRFWVIQNIIGEGLSLLLRYLDYAES